MRRFAHNEVHESCSLPFDRVFAHHRIAALSEKRFCGYRRVSNDATVRERLESVADKGSDSPPLIILVDVKPVEIPCGVDVAEAHDLSVENRYHGTVSRERAFPPFAVVCRARPDAQLFGRVVFCVHVQYRFRKKTRRRFAVRRVVIDDVYIAFWVLGARVRVALRRAGEAAPAVVLTVKAEFLAQPDGSEITVAFFEIGREIIHASRFLKSEER